MARLANQVFIVTGAASGIGRAVAVKFAEEGARILALDVDAERGRSLSGVREPLKGEIHFVHCDIAEEQEVESAIRETLETWGDVHGLVNAAALTPGAPLEETTVEFWDRMMRVNLRGAFVVAKATALALRQLGHGGAMVLFSSVGALSGTPGLAAYATSKGGVLSLVRTLAIELAPDNIRVNGICPGPNDTPAFRVRPAPLSDEPERFYEAFPLLRHYGRVIDPSETADAVLFLCSDESKFMTGTALVVDAGFLAK